MMKKALSVILTLAILLSMILCVQILPAGAAAEQGVYCLILDKNGDGPFLPMTYREDSAYYTVSNVILNAGDTVQVAEYDGDSFTVVSKMPLTAPQNSAYLFFFRPESDGYNFGFNFGDEYEHGAASSEPEVGIDDGQPCVMITSVTDDKTGVKLTWQKPDGVDVAFYRLFVERDGKWEKYIDTPELSHIYTGAVSGVTYHFTVRGLDANKGYCTDYYKPGWYHRRITFPMISSVRNTADGPLLQWETVNGNARYRVYLRHNADWYLLGDTYDTSFLHRIKPSGDGDILAAGSSDPDYPYAEDGVKYHYLIRCVSYDGYAEIGAYIKEGVFHVFELPPSPIDPDKWTTTQEAVAQYEAQTGETVKTYRYYFRMPDGVHGDLDEEGKPLESWVNEYSAGVGVYWWGDVPAACDSWPGYRANIADAEQHIYYADVPIQAENIIWNNGVYLADRYDPAYFYSRQSVIVPCENAEPDEWVTMPEGCDNFNDCIFVLYPMIPSTAEYYPSQPIYGSWYFNYGDGCYGMYGRDSAHFKSIGENCCNPDHFDADGKHIGYVPDDVIRGDYDGDGEITIMDATRAQNIIAELTPRPANTFLEAVDADGDKELTIMDATRIQNVIALLMTMDGMPLDEYELPHVG